MPASGTLSTSEPQTFARISGASGPLRPGVSVQMAVFNAMPYLVDAVESILYQSYQDFEFIIVDDGSTDDSLAYLQSVDDARIKIIPQSNRGTAAAGNVGLAHCTRQYLARMDADDWSDPSRLERLADALDANPDVSMVGSSFAYFGDRTAGRPVPMPQDHDSIYRALLRGDHGMVHGASMMRTDCMRAVGGYWEHRFFEDWDLFLRMAEVGKLMNVPDSLYLYRAHDTSLSSRRLEEMRLHYDYAIDQAKRRREGIPTCDLAEFQSQRKNRPVTKAIGERLDNIALANYRRAMGEIYGHRPLRGRMRLLSASLWNPRRTLNRIGRRFQSRID
ncbi:glycosyltransferase family 2 protein [Crateriforma conspicua]|nr:glycosyltransferase [Crateriforma conspicua]